MALRKPRTTKIPWQGRIISVQPRIRLLLSFDQRQHSYLGYVLCLNGIYGENEGEFLIAVGKGVYKVHQFRNGMELNGLAVPVADLRKEVAGFYKVSGVKVINKPNKKIAEAPPFQKVPPGLETYRARGHRRLSKTTYDKKCTPCIWGCLMPVEIIIDQWNPQRKKYRQESFCYGPKNCSFYKAGPTRKVPGRKGMTWEEEDWVDEQDTAHRGMND